MPMTGDSPPLLDFHHRFEAGTSGATLLLLHGTGGNEDDLLPMGRRIAPRANLLAPRGQVLENGMPRFFRRHAEGVFDEEDLVRRAADLDQFVRAALGHYGADPTRTHVFGYSNGANMAAALLLLHGSLFAGAALLRAVLPLEPRKLPDLTSKPILIQAGRRDPFAPTPRVQALDDRLRRAGAAVDLRWSSGGHEPEPQEIDALVTWFERLL